MPINASIASQELLPDLPAPELISSLASGRKMLLDEPATLYPDEYGINNV